jgi:hypothetical protein
MLDDLRMAMRLARDLRPFLRRPYTAAECRRLLADQLARRDESFLRVMAGAVFGHAGSPYLALLRHAGIELGDVAGWVRRGGVEDALGELYRAGVHVTLDEFKGRQPIRREGLALAVRDHAFDNPLLTAHFEGRTGGSRSAGTRAQIDLGLLAHESTSEQLFLKAFDALGRPMAIWRSALPVSAGMKTLLRHARIGIRAERWFSQSDIRPAPGLWKDYLFTRYAVLMSRAWGRPLPAPQFTPLDQAVVVARWLAQKKAAGTPALLDAAVSSAVRVGLAAREHGLDIEGTFVRVGSEPITEARARLIKEAGCRMSCTYSLAEVGRLGVGCSAATAVDEVHVVIDRVALLQRPRVVGGSTVGALFCSTLHPGVPKVMVNVELGDYGVLTERACGCPFDRLGYRHHLHTIRSYEKLTSEGMHFMGTELLHLVEVVLPARFGEHPTDYQLVEDEEGGLPRVSLVVSPRVGEIDEALMVATTLDALGSGQRGRDGRSMMAGYWRNARTLRVVRREPYATPAAKILALHVVRPSDR